MLTENRILTVLLFACAAMLIFCCVTPLAMQIGNAWAALIAAAVMIIAAIPVHCAGMRRSRKAPKQRRPLCWVASFLMNSVANGVAAAGLYIYQERAVTFIGLMGGMLPGLAVLCLAALLMGCFPAGKKPVLIVSALAALGLIVLQFVHVRGSWGAVFGLIIALFYLLADALTVGYERRPVLRDVSFGSFGAAMLIAIVVLAVISDGEALESLDGLGGLEFDDAGFDASGQADARRRARQQMRGGSGV